MIIGQFSSLDRLRLSLPLFQRVFDPSILLEDGRCEELGLTISREPERDAAAKPVNGLSVELLVSEDSSELGIAHKIKSRLLEFGELHHMRDYDSRSGM